MINISKPKFGNLIFENIILVIIVTMLVVPLHYYIFASFENTLMSAKELSVVTAGVMIVIFKKYIDECVKNKEKDQ